MKEYEELEIGTIIEYKGKHYKRWHRYKVEGYSTLGNKCRAVNPKSFPIVYVPDPYGDYRIISKPNQL